MTHYRCYFSLLGGVMLALELIHESKHYEIETVDEVCERLARSLNAEYIYREEIK